MKRLGLNNSKSIAHGFSWNLFGKLAYAASRGVILMLIAKLGSLEMVAQFALATAIATPVYMLADLNLRTVLATDVKSEYEFGHYFGLRFATVMISILVISGITGIIKLDTDTAAVIIFLSIAKGFEAMSDMIFGLFQKQEDMKRIGISLMIKGVLSVLAMGLFLYFRHSIVEGALGFAISWMIVLLAYDLRNARKYVQIKISLKISILRNLARLSLPLGVVLLFTSLNSYIPSYFIKGFLGSDSLGYYASIFYIMSVGDILVNSLGQTASSRLAGFYSDKNTNGFLRILFKSMLFITGISLFGLVIAYTAGGHILKILYTPDYAAYSGILTLIMLSSGMLYLSNLLNYAVTAARQFKIQPVLYGFVLIAGFVLNAVLVPVYGLEGAAYSSIVTALMLLEGNFIILIYALMKVDLKTAEMENENKADGWEPEIISIKNPGELADYIEEWREILQENRNDIVFIEPDWICRWWEVYGDNQEMFVLMVKNNKRIEGICPLAIRKKGIYKEICFIGSPQSSHFDLIIRESDRERTITTLFDYLIKLEGNGIFDFSGMLENSPNYGLVRKYLNEGKIPEYEGGIVSPVIKLDGRDYESYYKKMLSIQLQSQLRKRKNRLSKLGNLDFRRLNNSKIGEIFRLHDQRWKRKIDTSGFSDQKSQEFFSKLVFDDTLSFKAVVHSINVDERLLAFEYGLVCNKRYLSYRSAHNDLFSPFSPGKLLVSEIIRECFLENTKFFSFGIGYEPYKFEWTDDIEAVKSIVFAKPNLFSRLVFIKYLLKGKARDLLKRHRWLVLLKRNTLGELRYFFSIENMKKFCENTGRRLRKMKKPVVEYVYGKGNLLLLKKDIKYGINDELDQTYAIKPAGIGDIDALAKFMDCAPESIVKKLYQKQKCFIACREGKIVHFSWVSFMDGDGRFDRKALNKERNSACLYDYFFDKTYENADSAFHVLQYICKYLHAEKIRKLLIITDENDLIMKNASYRLGFVRGDRINWNIKF